MMYSPKKTIRMIPVIKRGPPRLLKNGFVGLRLGSRIMTCSDQWGGLLWCASFTASRLRPVRWASPPASNDFVATYLPSVFGLQQSEGGSDEIGVRRGYSVGHQPGTEVGGIRIRRG